jgi:hypothetical protein
VETPSWNIQAGVQRSLPPMPTTELTKHKVTSARLAGQYPDGLRRERKFMSPGVLGALRRKGDHAPVKIDFGPSQSANFLPALAKKKK